LIGDVAVIPIVYRPNIRGVHNQLQTNVGGWDNDTFMLSDWYKET
jgi:peptide/nickel transport system substrate-binding protein